MLKVYVGAPLSHWGFARKAMSALRASGHEVTHDWTIGAEAFYQGDHSEKSSAIAKKCIDGVAACDVAFFLLSMSTPTQGAWAEIGAALALQRSVVAYLHGADNDLQGLVWLSKAVFLEHPLCWYSHNYTACFRRLPIIENALFERRNAAALVEEFRPADFAGFVVGDAAYWAGKRYKVDALNATDFDVPHASLKSGCTSRWVPISALSKFSLN